MSLLILAQVSKYQVNPKQCIGCGLCVQSKSCPTNAISMKNGKAIIDADKCISCGICQNGNQSNYKGCPVDAISTQIVEKKVVNLTPQASEKSQSKPIIEKKSNTPQKAAKTDSVKVQSKEETVLSKIIYYVESKTCISCRLCVSSCPTGAISIQNGKAVIDTEKCISCGLCKNGNPSTGYKGCPVSAIKTK